MTCHRFASGIVCASPFIVTEVEGQEIEIDFHYLFGPSFTARIPYCDLGYPDDGELYEECPIDIPTEAMWAAFDAWVETWPDTIPEEGS